MVELILGIIQEVLKLGVIIAEERHRYDDDILRIQRKFADEYAKPDDEISDALLIEYERELQFLGEAVINSLKSKNSKA